MPSSRSNSKGKSDKEGYLVCTECQTVTQIIPSSQINLRSWYENLHFIDKEAEIQRS